MRRFVLALLVTLTAASAFAADPLVARVTIYQRLPHLVDGAMAEFQYPNTLIAPPASGWPATYDGVRAVLSERVHHRNRREVMIAQIFTPKPLSATENTDWFIDELQRAVELKLNGDKIEVLLPKAPAPVVIPATAGTNIIGAKDEEFYVGVTLLPPAKVVNDTVVITNGMPPLKVVSQVEAEYPKVDAFRNKSGSLFAQLKVGKDGSVTGVDMLDHVNPQIESAAADAFKKWRFEPPVRDGKPVVAYMIMMAHWRVD